MFEVENKVAIVSLTLTIKILYLTVVIKIIYVYSYPLSLFV